jgi:DNA-binding transcriptional LysR family regulator
MQADDHAVPPPSPASARRLPPMSGADAGRERWLGVELRHLAALVAVAEAGTFRRAADELGYVQSAVSQQIAFLERTVGVRLIERSPGPGPVTLTDAGRVLLRHACEIVARLHGAQADLDASLDRSSGMVAVGLDGIAQAHVMPGLLAALAATCADVQVMPSEVSSAAERLALVQRGVLDLAFVDLPLDGGRFGTCEVLRDPYVLLLHASHPLAALQRLVRLDDLTELRLAASPLRGPGEASRGPAHGASPELVQAMVERGHCEAILPALSVRAGRGASVAIDLGHLLPAHVLGLCWHEDRDLRPAVRALVEAVQEWRTARAELHAAA